MGTVSNPASLSSLRSVTSGPANFSGYIRGGSYIPIGASSAISTTVVGLRLSTFNGYSTGAALSASASPANLSVSTSGSTIAKTMTTPATTVTPSGGTGSYTHSWTLINVLGINNPVINSSSNAASVTGTINDSNAVGTTGTATLRDTVTSGTSTKIVDIPVNLTYYYISCVVTRSYLSSGQRASKARVGQSMLVTDPHLSIENSVRAIIRRAEKHFVQCVRITTANGAWLECSRSAPIPVKDGRLVNAPDLLGLSIATSMRPDDMADHIDIDWSEVVEVKPIGRRRVQLIFVDNRCFWASGDGRRFILHHNAKPITIP